MRASVLLLLTLGLAAGARADDAAVARAFAAIDGQSLTAAEADARVHALIAALDEAGLPRSATVALAALSTDEKQAEGIRKVAREELVIRAARDASLAQSLLAEQDTQGKLPPALALRLARSHLERALQLSPLEEGIAFTGVAEGPALANASVEEKPLDADLAKEMGAARIEEEKQKAPADDREPVAGRRAKIEIDRARALAATVPETDASAIDAHEVGGLAALALGDSDGAEKEFLAVVKAPRVRGDADRRDRAFLQLARLAYQRGDDARSTQLYEKVGRGAPEWLDALFEASWSHFRKGQDERALGNLLTLHAPFFQGRFFPESFVLKALVLYQNCRYGEARAALVEFAQRYQGLQDGLQVALEKLPTAQSAYELIAGGPVRIESTVPVTAREEVARLGQEPELAAAVKAVQDLGQEIDSFDRRPAQSRAFAARMLPAARKARIALLETTGARLYARIASERAELRELLGQSLRLSYEIAGREKEMAAEPENGLATAPHHEKPQVDEDEVLWPFQGEYWRDELGSYRFQLGQRCRKPREAPMQAQEPARVEPRAAAGQ